GRIWSLVRQGASVRTRAREAHPGWTVLLEMALGGRAALMREALDRGAEIDAGDERGYTPLISAVRSGNPEAVRVLLERGASVNARDTSGETALQWAILLEAKPEILRL